MSACYPISARLHLSPSLAPEGRLTARDVMSAPVPNDRVTAAMATTSSDWALAQPLIDLLMRMAFGSGEAELQASMRDLARTLRRSAADAERDLAALERNARAIEALARAGVRAEQSRHLYSELIRMARYAAAQIAVHHDAIVPIETIVTAHASAAAAADRTEAHREHRGFVDDAAARTAALVLVADHLECILARDEHSHEVELAMRDLRKRSAAIGAPAFWGEPIFDDGRAIAGHVRARGQGTAGDRFSTRPMPRARSS